MRRLLDVCEIGSKIYCVCVFTHSKEWSSSTEGNLEVKPMSDEFLEIRHLFTRKCSACCDGVEKQAESQETL